MGGIRTGTAFRANIMELERLCLNPRVLHDVRSPETTCNILGFPLSMPILVAPMAGTSFNMGGCISEEDFALAMVEGARQAGTIACTGDGTSGGFRGGIKAITSAGGWGIPVIKPWAQDTVHRRLESAAKAGCKAVGMDIDKVVPSALVTNTPSVSPKSPDEVRSMVEQAHGHGLKFFLKGIMSVEDSRLAAACGCDAIVVSNHGGRVLEAMPGTAAVLPGIAHAVPGMPVLADGGIRTGADVLKMLALGACAVLVGRPMAVAALGGGASGVSMWLKRLHRQLWEAMLMTGCATLRETGSHLLALPRFAKA